MDGDGRCVLVVEDDIGVGRFATRLIDDLGYRTHRVTSAVQAFVRMATASTTTSRK